MTNTLYPLWKASVMTEADTNNSLDQTGANAPVLALLSIGSGFYNYSASHKFYTDLSAIVGTPVPLTSNALVSNVFQAGGVVFTGVSGPNAIGALVIYRANTGANSTWRLVLYEDTDIVGFPMVPNGGNLLVSWSSQGVFAL